MTILPLALPLELEAFTSLPTAKTMVRHLSDMAGYYADQEAVRKLLPGNPLIYEFTECEYAGQERGLSFGITRICPGTVGREYHMTKGHFHLNGGDEIYIAVRGKGMLVLQAPDGRVESHEMVPGRLHYLPGNWGHRTMNIGEQDFIFLAVWVPGIEHDYDTVARAGLRKRVLRGKGGAQVVDNP